MDLRTEGPLEIWNDGMLEYWVIKRISSFQCSNIPSFRHVCGKVQIFRPCRLAMPEKYLTPMM